MIQVPSDKTDRQRAFSEPSTRELLRRLLTDQKPLTPEVGPDGKVHYRVIDEILGPDVDTKVWINQMLELGILRESGHRDMVSCPTHGRVDPLVQLECAKCKARSMKKSTLVEHVLCGYIEADTRFNKDGFLVCPNCKRQIRRPDELRSSGVWFECKSCQTKTSTPRMVFTCRDGHEFTTLELALQMVYTYEVDASVVAQLKNTLVLTPALGDMFGSLGYEIVYPATVQGRSGTKHSVDIYAKNPKTDVAVQIAVDSKPIEPTAVISFFAKTYDIKPKLAILIAIPAASDAAKQISAGYDIVLVEDSDGTGAVQKVRELLQRQTIG
jgi:hypothetical protein